MTATFAADRIQELEAKLAKKDGNMGETYQRWQNGADLRVLAKEAGCTQERIRLKLKKYEGDKVRVLEAKLAKAVRALENIAYGGAYTDMQIARITLAELKGEQDD